MLSMNPAVFLDLDKTVIQDTNGSPDPDDVLLIKGAAPAIASLRGLGYRIVVVANHEGVARGRITEDQVHALHDRVSRLVNKTANGAVIDAFYYCPFHPRGTVKGFKKDHANRKPKPGMLTQAAGEMALDLASSWMIGDELADIQAGHSAGTRTILLRPDADRLQPVDPEDLQGITTEEPDRERPTGPDFYAVGLVDAARLIAQQPRVDQADTAKPKPGRKWDAEKIAKIQVPRPEPKEPAAVGPSPEQQPSRAFRPWGAPLPEQDDEPIVAKPFRKRQQPAGSLDGEDVTPAVSAPLGASTPLAKNQSAAKPIPENIRQAVEKKKLAEELSGYESESREKLLRMILQELRSQRGTTQEFSFLTIVAVALQLIAVVCLLGGLFMGGGDDGLFLRWLGAAVVAQLTGIVTLLYGR